MFTKLDDCSFNRSRDMTGAPELKIGHVTATTPIWETVCRPKIKTSYWQPVCKIWSL